MSNTADDFFQQGVVFLNKGLTAEAHEFFINALTLNPKMYEACNNLGKIAVESGDFDEAIKFFSHALQLNPDFEDAIFNLAKLYSDLCQYDLAIKWYLKALEINPLSRDSLYNLANLYERLNQPELSVQLYYQLLESYPDDYETYNNLAVAYYDLAQPDLSALACKKAIEIKPDYAEPYFHLALCHLVIGDYLNGWRLYEYRWQRPQYRQYKLQIDCPYWEGQDIAGKSILVYCEQGYGDSIQFVRFIADLRSHLANVVLLCPPALQRLLIFNKLADKIICDMALIPKTHYCIALMSLPYALKLYSVDKLGKGTYLKVNATAWADKVNNISSGRLKVGIAWKGSSIHKDDSNRSLPISKLNEISKCGDFAFFNLSKDVDKDAIPKNVVNIVDGAKDFYDTACIIMNLDIIIAVDTAVAHLAGALGKMTWLLLPFAPDWRWGLNSADSVWYERMQIFRQDKIGNWTKPVMQIINKLRDFSKAKRVD